MKFAACRPSSQSVLGSFQCPSGKSTLPVPIESQKTGIQGEINMPAYHLGPFLGSKVPFLLLFRPEL